MSTSIQWVGTMGIVSSILSFLVILAGLVLTALAYFNNKSRAALLGALGFLLMFLFSCCSLGGTMGWSQAMMHISGRSTAALIAVRGVIMFLASLLKAVGLALIVAAIWTATKREN